MTVQVEFLKSTPYFSGLSPAELDSVNPFIFEKRSERGELVVLEGELAQVLFFEGDTPCKTSYADRNGKYQNQNDITLPKA